MARRKKPGPDAEKAEIQSQEPADASGPIDFYSDGSDGGDDTQRNFRYQSAYGAILIVKGQAKDLDYRYLWCENFEDFVTEDKQGKLFAYQVKTRQTSDGAWKISDGPFVQSIQRFIKLFDGLGDRLSGYAFVSNVEFSNRQGSLKKLVESVKSSVNLAALDTSLRTDLDTLASKCGCDSQKIFTLFKKLELTQGPSREDFDATISHDYIPKLAGCKSLAPEKLNEIRDELMLKVWYASSKYNDGISRHHPFVGSERDKNLLAKRISIDELEYSVEGASNLRLQFAQLSDPLNLSEIGSLETLEKKLVQAGLADRVSAMKHRALSAQGSLLTLQQKDPVGFDALLNQLDSKVRLECDDARVQAEADPSNFGGLMLRHLSSRLRQASEGNQSAIEGADFDLLMGLAGLLSDECKVWFNRSGAWEAENDDRA